MYIFAIILLSFFAYLEVFNRDIVERNKVLFAFICFAFLVFHDGFRWETGCDWIPYSRYFDKLFVDYTLENPTFEIGYFLFLAPIRLVTDNYSVYLIIHAIVFYGLIFYTVFKLSISPFISLLLLYMIIVPYLGTNRQFLVLAIYIFGLCALIKGKKLLFAVLMILCCFFHKSAFICLIALLAGRKIKKVYLLAFLALAIALSFSGIVNELSPLMTVFFINDESMEKFEYYTSQTYELSLSASILSILKKSLWIGVLMLFDDKIENKPKSYYLFFNLYVLGCFFYLLFNGTAFQVFVSRALMYFNVAEMFIVPYVILLFKPNYGKLAMMLVLSLYVVINVEKGFSNYGEGNDFFEPYKGLFINTDYERHSM